MRQRRLRGDLRRPRHAARPARPRRSSRRTSAIAAPIRRAATTSRSAPARARRRARTTATARRPTRRGYATARAADVRHDRHAHVRGERRQHDLAEHDRAAPAEPFTASATVDAGPVAARDPSVGRQCRIPGSQRLPGTGRRPGRRSPAHRRSSRARGRPFVVQTSRMSSRSPLDDSCSSRWWASASPRASTWVHYQLLTDAELHQPLRHQRDLQLHAGVPEPVRRGRRRAGGAGGILWFGLVALIAGLRAARRAKDRAGRVLHLRAGDRWAGGHPVPGLCVVLHAEDRLRAVHRHLRRGASAFSSRPALAASVSSCSCLPVSTRE